MNSENYCQYVRPFAGNQIRLLKLDVEFEAGQGDRLTARYNGGTFSVLDLLGGFGANLLGHNHPEITRVAEEFFKQGRVQQAQVSLRASAAELGRRLSVLCEPMLGVGSIAHLSSTGSEAVEVALKNSFLKYEDRVREWRAAWNGVQDQLDLRVLTIPEVTLAMIECSPVGVRIQPWLDRFETAVRDMTIAKIERAYHGRTLAAMSASDSPLARHLPRGLAGYRTTLLPADGPAAILTLLKTENDNVPYPEIRDGELHLQWREWNRVAAIMVEPVQGEGGIFVLESETAAALNRLARETGAPLIADEIQCGLGRTGRFFASQVVGLQPDVVLLGKSLGGGVAKIAATIFSTAAYHRITGRFGSTFAEDDFSCSIALRTLEILESERGEHRARVIGEEIGETLERLHDEFPDVVKECRGVGLMYGLELRSFESNPSCMLRLFQSNGLPGFLMASFLLHRHSIRIAPSLSMPNTLRIEPSIFFDSEYNELLYVALSEMCRAIRGGDFAFLTSHLRENTARLALPRDFRDSPRRPRFDTERADVTIGFVGHLMDLAHLPLFDSSLAGIDLKQLISWYRKGEGFFGPAAFDRVRVRGLSGKTCDVRMIGIYETPITLAAAIRSRDKGALLGRVQEAVDLARKMGCEVVGLGGLTSILASNGTTVESRGMTLTTGNSLTAAMTVAAFEKAAVLKGLESSRTRVGIVGAVGNIGLAYTKWALSQFPEVHLFGSSASLEKNSQLIAALKREHPYCKVEHSSDLGGLKDCDAIVTMTNEAEAVIRPEHLSDRVRVILDVAVPHDVDPAVRAVFPNILVIEGGWVRVPGFQGTLISGMDTPPGHTLACMAETIVLGLSGVRRHFSYGDIQEKKVKEIYQLAHQEGFVLGDFRSSHPTPTQAGRSPSPGDRPLGFDLQT